MPTYGVIEVGERVVHGDNLDVRVVLGGADDHLADPSESAAGGRRPCVGVSKTIFTSQPGPLDTPILDPQDRAIFATH